MDQFDLDDDAPFGSPTVSGAATLAAALVETVNKSQATNAEFMVAVGVLVHEHIQNAPDELRGHLQRQFARYLTHVCLLGLDGDPR